MTKFFDALSLSGAIIFLFFTLTVVGIVKGDKDIWHEFGTALTTFATGRKIGEYDSKRTLTVEEKKDGANT